jgi:hypothetical protein
LTGQVRIDFWHLKDMIIRPAGEADRDWIVTTLVERWGSTTTVTRCRPCDAAGLDALVALDPAGERVGLLTWRLDEDGLGWSPSTRRGPALAWARHCCCAPQS